jgi:hypothetical protein
MSSRHLKPILCAYAALAGVVLSIGVTGASASLVWNGDLETGNFSQYSTTYCYQSYSCEVVSAPGGHAGLAARFQIASGETSPIGNAHAQVQDNSNEKSGDESWWHWEVYLPSDFQDSSSFWQVITEWHQYALGGGACNCPGSPPLTFQEINGHYVVRIVNSADPTQGNYWTQYDLGPAPRGGWTSFDLHAKWSTDPSVAVTDVYVNGVQSQHITGHPNEYTGYFNYFLGGWYRASDAQAQTMYLDNVRRGNSLADVQGTSSTSSTTTTAATTTSTPTTSTTSFAWSTSTSTTTSTTTAATTSTTTPTTTTAKTTTTTPTTASTSTTTTSATAPAPPPYTVSITSPAAGANLTGRVTWTAQTSGATTREVDFFIDGNQKWTEYWAPYFFGGDNQYWDTATVKNGNHTLMVRAISTSGQVVTSTISVTVNNTRKARAAT